MGDESEGWPYIWGIATHPQPPRRRASHEERVRIIGLSVWELRRTRVSKSAPRAAAFFLAKAQGVTLPRRQSGPRTQEHQVPLPLLEWQGPPPASRGTCGGAESVNTHGLKTLRTVGCVRLKWRRGLVNAHHVKCLEEKCKPLPPHADTQRETLSLKCCSASAVLQVGCCHAFLLVDSQLK